MHAPENNIGSNISKADNIKFSHLIIQIRHNTGNPFLAVIAVDTSNLAGAFINYFSTAFKSKTHIINGNDENTVKTVFDNENKDFLNIVNIFDIDARKVDNIMQIILFSRDYLLQRKLRIILICNFETLEKIQIKAHDLISVSSFADYFSDLSASISYDLSPFPEKPAGLVEFEEAYEALLEYKKKKDINNETLIRKLLDTGNKAYTVSKNQIALQLFEEGLQLSEQENDKEFISLFLGNIGLIYQDKGELDEALKYHKQALKIDKQTGYLQGQANNLGNIGNIYYGKSKLDEALKYHKEALEVDKQAGYLLGQASDLGNIGVIYKNKGELDKALNYYKQALEIQKHIGYKQGQADQLGNIGSIYYVKGDLDKTLTYYKEALEIYKEIGYLQGQANQLSNIGLIYRY